MTKMREAIETLKCRPEGHSAPLTVAVLEAMAAENEKLQAEIKKLTPKKSK